MSPLLPIGAFAASALSVLALIKYRAWKERKSARKTPVESGMLREPGKSSREEIAALSTDIETNLTMALIIPVLVSATFGSIAPLVSLIGAAVLLAVCLRKIHSALNKRAQYRQGLVAELVVGQELNQLMLAQFRVFHDFPADGFNIDHIVIGATGVFAIETKSRKKPKTRNKGNEYEATYDGKCLRFHEGANTQPWVETGPIEQAMRQAKELQKWLSQAVAEQIFVQPVIALPGWNTNLIEKPHRVNLINGKNCTSFFNTFGGGKPLSQQLQARIAHVVDQHCRVKD